MHTRSAGPAFLLLAITNLISWPVQATPSASVPPATPEETAAASPQTPPAAEPAPKRRAELDGKLFPVPPELSAAVDFWTTVYTGYDNHVVLLHDERHLHIIYAALDFGELERSDLSKVRQQRIRRQRISEAREKYRSILASSAAGKVSKAYPNDQARVEELFDRVAGDRRKYSAAVGRLRTQTCLRNRFAEAVVRSGHYLPEMERILAKEGLPRELTRLPFVESLFQTNARSSAAAGGVWQFVPSTARLYLRMSAEYDERFDPLTATAAAAQLLSENYQALGSWPLALTAYNHGRAGMKRAVRNVGSKDLGEIVKRYRSRTFGFASRNFYAEFVAAYLAYEDRHVHFPGVEPDPLLRFDSFAPSDFVALPDLARAANLDVDELRHLNPALSREVWHGDLFLPKTYGLRVPAGRLADITAAYQELPANRKARHQVGHRYRVRRGDTLGGISRRFGTSVAKLKRANGIRGHLIRSGQTLLIPPSHSPVSISNHPLSSPPADGVHVVRRGESLTAIARRYGTDILTLQSTNGLASPDRLRIGQQLKIPGSGSTSHVVRRGDTLASIAQRYGTSIAALRRTNNLTGDLIRPDQVLIIP